MTIDLNTSLEDVFQKEFMINKESIHKKIVEREDLIYKLHKELYILNLGLMIGKINSAIDFFEFSNFKIAMKIQESQEYLNLNLLINGNTRFKNYNECILNSNLNNYSLLDFKIEKFDNNEPMKLQIMESLSNEELNLFCNHFDFLEIKQEVVNKKQIEVTILKALLSTEDFNLYSKVDLEKTLGINNDSTNKDRKTKVKI